VSRRSERFNRAMLSVDAESIDPAKNHATSDGGLGVERLTEAIDYDTRAETAREKRIRAEREEKLFQAEMRLVEAGKGYLIRVLLLIVENFYNREESFKSVPRRTYFRHLKQLIEFFCGTQVDMDI